jgi:hypothetical protein
MVTTASSGGLFRTLGTEFHNRADGLQEFLAEAPRQIRLLRVYGDYLTYVGNEIDRATAAGIDLTSSPGLNISGIEQTLTWDVPNPRDIGLTFTTSSGTTNVTSELMVKYAQEQPNLALFQNPPESFRMLQTTKDANQTLNRLKPQLGDTWQRAWDAIAVGNLESVKTAAVNARTVVDEISWMTQYEHLKTLDWCKLDDNGNPTRATRYAWILHGDTLPAGLSNDPSNDFVWKPFRDAYKRLSKYVHIADIAHPDVIYVENHIKTIQIALEQYLREGSQRLGI